MDAGWRRSGAGCAKPEWDAYATKNLMLVTLDFPKDKALVPEKYLAQNAGLKTKFSITGYPSYIILDSDGETKLGKLGAAQDKTPASFIEEVKTVLNMRQTNIDAKVVALGAAKGAEYLAAIKGYKTAETTLADWLATRPVRNDENTAKFADLRKSLDDARAKLSTF